MARVGIVCGAGILSGKEIMALELGRGLKEQGEQVHFVTSHWGTGEFGRRAEGEGFTTHRMWLGYISVTRRWSEFKMTMDQLRRWPALVTSYRRFLRVVQPAKVIHTNWHHALLLLPWLNKKRDLYWAHEITPDKPQYRCLFRLLGRRIGGFVGVSGATERALIRIGVPPGRVLTIYNGLADPASEAASPEPVGSTVGIVGQIGPWKGHEDLIAAVHQLRRSGHDLRLHIFGKGRSEYEALLRSRVSGLGLDEIVTWHGFVNERADIFARLAILVVPSRSEDPLPTTAIEAAFFRIPVVASKRGGLPEIVDDGTTGYLFEPGNAGDLAGRLATLLANPMLRTRMGNCARERAIKVFGRGRFVQQFLKLLRDRES